MESHISGIAINFSGLKLLDSLGNSSLTGGRLFPVAVELGCFNISGAASCCNAPAGLACLRLLGYLIQGGVLLKSVRWSSVFLDLISGHGIINKYQISTKICCCQVPMFNANALSHHGSGWSRQSKCITEFGLLLYQWWTSGQQATSGPRQIVKWPAMSNRKSVFFRTGTGIKSAMMCTTLFHLTTSEWF